MNDDPIQQETPAELVPRLENVKQRLQNHDEQDLDVAEHIIDYVIAQLQGLDDE